MMILILGYIAAFWTSLTRSVRRRLTIYGDGVFGAVMQAFFASLALSWDLTIIVLMLTMIYLTFASSAGGHLSSKLPELHTWPVTVDEAIESSITLKQVQGVTSFFVFVRFLYFLGQSNRRFAVVFNTLRRSFVDLITIIGLWVFALFACTLAGVVCFGYGTTEAFNLQTTFFDLFNTGSGGNPNYYDYTASRREAAPVFWLFYFICCFFVLYNMVVAVLTGTFADVKNEMFNGSVVERVLRQEEEGRWYRKNLASSFWSQVKCSALVGEIRHAYRVVKFRGDVPLRLALENPRIYWHFMSEVWHTIDTGIPADVIFTAIRMTSLSALTLAEDGRRWNAIRRFIDKKRLVSMLQQRKPRKESNSNPETVKASNPLAAFARRLGSVAFAQQDEVRPDGPHGGTSAVTTDDRHKSLSRLLKNAVVIASLAARTQSMNPTTTGDEIHVLITYADRRLPLWGEYLYYLFKGERSHVERHLVWLTSRLLAIPQPNLWLNAVEEWHYYNVQRACYTVDLSESRVVTLTKLLPNVEEIDHEALQMSGVIQKLLGRRAAGKS